MATLTIRNIDDDLKARLRVEAAQHGHSMEEEVRTILRAVLNKPRVPQGLGTRIHQRFLEVGGVDLDLPARQSKVRIPDFTE